MSENVGFAPKADIAVWRNIPDSPKSNLMSEWLPSLEFRSLNQSRVSNLALFLREYIAIGADFNLDLERRGAVADQ